ncbi:MAG: Hcp family type VI secretion system effector [Deltaproteobacteria bacterium]|nr:Hcp family type VI secretion system effector [Deltaproteobacteria bacterium]
MALNAYLTLTGETQGEIKGSVTQAGREDSIMVIAFDYEVESPRDAASGLPTGKRQHKGITITKEVDKSSPLLMNLLVNNENITEWKLECWEPSKTGREHQYYTIELYDASVAKIKGEMLNNKYPENMQHKERETITFTYRKIVWTYMEGGITAEDDWEAPNA